MDTIKTQRKDGELLNASLQFIASPEDLEYLERNGHIKLKTRKYSGTKALPYQSAYNCLLKNTPMREAKFSDIDATAKEWARDHENTYGKKTRSKDLDIANKKYRTKYSQVPQCHESSQMGEGIADLWAAKVAGRFMEPMNHLGKTDAIRLNSLYVGPICNDLLNHNIRFGNASADPHSPSRERVELMLFQEPRIRKAFNCEEPPKHNCLSLVGTPIPKASRDGGTREAVR